MGDMADWANGGGYGPPDEDREGESWYDRDDTDDFEEHLCVMESQKAICVLMHGAEQWIPRSCLGPRNEVESKGQRGRLSVATWFVEKEGLE